MSQKSDSTKRLLIVGAIGIVLSLAVSTLAQRKMDGNLVSAGKVAPSFSLRGVDNRPVVSGEILPKRKAVLVNFWFVACPSCRAEFPHLQKTYTRLKSQGLEIVAVNISDDAATTKAFVREQKLTFRFALDDGRTALAYGVTSTPTNYLLDSKGRIVWRATGFDGDGHALEEALRGMGFQI